MAGYEKRQKGEEFRRTFDHPFSRITGVEVGRIGEPQQVFLGMQHDPQFIAMLVDFLETQRELPAYLLPRLLCVGLYTAYSLAPAQALPGGMGSWNVQNI